MFSTDKDPLYFLLPSVATFGASNLGADRQAQINNGVRDPDPDVWVDGQEYNPGDLVSSPAVSEDFTTSANVLLPPDIRQSSGFATEAQRNLAQALLEQRIAVGRTVGGSLGNVYVCLRTTSDGNPDTEERIKNNPFAVQPEDSDIKWNFVRKTNEQSLLDRRSNILTGREDETQFIINCEEGIDTIALINIRASSLTWTFTRDGVVYGGDRIDLTDIGSITNYADYLLRRPNFVRNHIIRNIPKFSHRLQDPIAGQLVITLRNPGAPATIGQVVPGNEYRLGLADGDSFRAGFKDFSEIRQDDFGTTATTPRGATFRHRIKCVYDRNLTDNVEQFLIQYRGGNPIVFYATPNELAGSTLYGYIKQADIKYLQATTDMAELDVQTEGLL
ncbi:MAG: hypothetical protein K0U41_05060 [Gammaproteobacteria bacterium]|nr:hypothetical protein [Gammaproteobacteria bacterium]